MSGFVGNSQGLLIILIIAASSMFALGFPTNRPYWRPNLPHPPLRPYWPPNLPHPPLRPYWPPNLPQPPLPPLPPHAGSPKTINVGGSENWRFGFNYTDWSFNNGPFFIKDTLVFKYDPPNSTTFPHSVYLLPDFWSFQKCDLRRAKLVGNVSQGGGEGFKFQLNKWRPYYFVCGERAGVHCNIGMMKFAVFPLPRFNNGY